MINKKIIRPMPVVRLGSQPWEFLIINPGWYSVQEINNPINGFGAKWLKTTIDGRDYGTSVVTWEEHSENGRR
ncbi:MAG TPA: hypothetical protein PK412_01285 [bacterium]|nr:hypothetical protein [bacterium]HNW09507.1 hypothetical protein [bacterium]HOH67437.1 hypothetical protein [bacterium]HPN81169.1 hypothetical protein [bacterium]HQA63918.1 hypothetical protein [bacterium]